MNRLLSFSFTGCKSYLSIDCSVLIINLSFLLLKVDTIHYCLEIIMRIINFPILYCVKFYEKCIKTTYYHISILISILLILLVSLLLTLTLLSRLLLLLLYILCWLHIQSYLLLRNIIAMLNHTWLFFQLSLKRNLLATWASVCVPVSTDLRANRNLRCSSFKLIILIDCQYIAIRITITSSSVITNLCYLDFLSCNLDLLGLELGLRSCFLSFIV